MLLPRTNVKLHLKGSRGPIQFIACESSSFYSVKDATVRTMTGSSRAVSVALVNKTFVSLLSIQDEQLNTESVATDRLRPLQCR